MITGMLVDQRGHFLQARLMYKLLASYGLMKNGSHIIAPGFPPTRLQGDGVESFGAGIFKCEPASRTRHAKHRLSVKCTGCGKFIPFGRMVQHVKVHNKAAVPVPAYPMPALHNHLLLVAAEPLQPHEDFMAIGHYGKN